MKYLEDMVVGTKASFGHYDVRRDEVIEFASKYDPQAFHLDDEAAAKTHFGRLSASGWHTCAMTMAMLVENLKDSDQASLGSPGHDGLRWLRPVYPGDVLRVETELTEVRPSRSRPEMGSVHYNITVFNQDDKPVLTMKSIGLMSTRPKQTSRSSDV
ncbi:MaoC family dehydratase [Pacificimonas sp. WHA3]|uniref:MaoC family dehydratase n=1 Tax=Pacificimonas pallii TaxID=2827236 RepID=A0ABS6SBN6_9SPHN|nr:MaoC family dehydratase [Pacificimonas pallii]MBV7255833.1 MaoC family dehydratase [Pacificimonas pallii]